MNADEIGAAIRQKRQLYKLTQAEVAAAANVGVRFVVEMEAGKATARLDKLLAVMAVMGMAISIQDR